MDCDREGAGHGLLQAELHKNITGIPGRAILSTVKLYSHASMRAFPETGSIPSRVFFPDSSWPFLFPRAYPYNIRCFLRIGERWRGRATATPAREEAFMTF